MSELEIELIKYTKKTWAKSGVLGFIIGLAVIVPGISGSTVAIIFKLYDQFLYAIGHLFKDFKRCFAFLLPIGIGMVIGLVAGFLGVQKLVDIAPFAVVCLFSGLMIGAFPAVKAELKGAERTPIRVALFAVGVLFPIAIGCISAWIFSRTPNTLELRTVENGFSRVDIKLLLALPIGYALGITQIVPGLSASALLMTFGWFGDLIDSVGMTFWQNSPVVFAYYAVLGVGFLLGIFTFSRLLTFLFKQARFNSYSVIVGLSLGSIISMFFNADIFAIYLEWSRMGVNVFELVLGLVLLAMGAVISYLLVRYQRKKDLEKDNAAA